MKISTILDNIEYGYLALPEFQRGYVWGRDQVRGLFSSLYRRYPVGSFLVWTTEADSVMTRGAGPYAGAVIKLLLDGQQRATSLYGVMRGAPPAFFQGNDKAFSDLYFDLRTEAFEFYGPVKMRDDPFWISVTELFQRGVEELLNQVAEHVIDNRTLVAYNNRLARLTDVRDIDLHIEEITGRDKTVDEVVEIFNRVNSGGTKLSAGDLALARMCADWPAARTELRRMLGSWSDAGFDFKQEWLLRCATAVATNQASFGALRTVSVTEFAVALKKTEQAVDFLLNLVGDRLGLDHDRVLAGRYAFAALVGYVAARGGSVDDYADQQRLLYWYVHSFLWGRYSGSTETVLQRDLDAITAGGIDNLIEELSRWRGTLFVRPEDFDGWSIGARFYPLLYLLTRVSGARDLGNGMQLSHGLLGAHSALHIHHVFPKKRLYDAGYERSVVNALANFCFLTARSNLAIGADDPAQYLPAVAAAQPGVLESQWIPTEPSLWQTNRYPQFLAARRELLASASNDLLESLLQGRRGRMQPEDLDIERRPIRVEAPDYEEDQTLVDIRALVRMLGIAEPELHYEINDEDSGDTVAMADLAWPDGVQHGRTQPVAFLLESDEEMQARLSELGYRFFTTKDRFVWYLEEIFGADIDGDAMIGFVEDPESCGEAADEDIGSAGQQNDLEERFHAAMVELYQRAKNDVGYNATLFLRMLSDHGGLETARRLITSSRPSDGFTALWERGRLDLSVEAYALRPEFEPLFERSVLQAARERLQQYGYKT